MTTINHDKYTFELPAGWITEPQASDDIPLHTLFVDAKDKGLPTQEVNVLGTISDFTYFVQEEKRSIDMYDLVETFETWAHLKKFKFDEPVEISSPRPTIKFEVIGTAQGPERRHHFVWLVGDTKTVVRVHFVVRELNPAARKAMETVIQMVSSIRLGSSAVPS